MPVLQIVVTSTRPGRKGPHVAAWFAGRAREHGVFDVEVVDLAEVGLPMFDEPNHPSQRAYVHDHTKRWSERVSRADAFVFVTPEYNHGTPPALVNALDHLLHEWAYKPAAFVSYGGISGGTRSVVMSKSLLTSLKVMPIPESVAIPMIGRHFPNPEGPFVADDRLEHAPRGLLDELARWEHALRALRRP